jgi:hypothetical protein
MKKHSLVLEIEFESALLYHEASEAILDALQCESVVEACTEAGVEGLTLTLGDD